jgi:hypothetical protein
MGETIEQVISNLWLISRTALATAQYRGRHSSMCYVKQELIKGYPRMVEGMTGKQIWFTIENIIN